MILLKAYTNGRLEVAGLGVFTARDVEAGPMLKGRVPRELEAEAQRFAHLGTPAQMIALAALWSHFVMAMTQKIPEGKGLNVLRTRQAVVYSGPTICRLDWEDIQESLTDVVTVKRNREQSPSLN